MKVSSISELKDGLSAHLDLVRSGEIVVVTDRKSPVATLARIEPGSMAGNLSTMVSDGILAPRRARLDVEAFLAMPAGRCREGLGAAIIEERGEGER